MEKITANQIQGRAIGATFFAVFGTAWVILGLYAKQILNPGTGGWAGMILLVLLSTAIWLFRQGHRFTRTPEDPGRGRAFMAINAIQWIAVGIAGFTFARLHLDSYVICAITAIIGLHMFPLARLFRYPMHVVSGSVLVAWAALSALLVPADHLQGTAAIGTGIILILSAYVTLALAGTLVRRTGVPATANQTATRF
jgi:hypothetical protein